MNRPIIQKTQGRVNMKLRESAKYAPWCFGCFKQNPNGDLLCLAHSNKISAGKAKGLKAIDELGAILCQHCHDYVDGRGKKATREQMQSYHEAAHIRTYAWWKKNGYL